MIKHFLEDYFLDKDLKQIFKGVLGITDIDALEILISDSITPYIKSSIEKVLFIQSSIGVVFGFSLRNQENIVLKIYSPKISKEYLDKMNQVQELLSCENYPIPKVLSPIFQIGTTHAGLYSWIDGAKADAHKPDIREELAKHLAWFTTLVQKHQLKPLTNFFQQNSRKKLWPITHNSMFDFKKSTKGAGWIARKALCARKILNQSTLKPMLAHLDWGVKNASFKNSTLVGVFDWDSLGSMSELEMLGRACSQFTADWEFGLKITPSPIEAQLFIESYEKHRSKKFTLDEKIIISASADYHIATIARFEHAGPQSDIHPYQDLLRACGEKSFLLL